MRTASHLEWIDDMRSDMSDEELQRRETKEDIVWSVCLVLGCVLLLGAAWLS